MIRYSLMLNVKLAHWITCMHMQICAIKILKSAATQVIFEALFVSHSLRAMLLTHCSTAHIISKVAYFLYRGPQRVFSQAVLVVKRDLHAEPEDVIAAVVKGGLI